MAWIRKAWTAATMGGALLAAILGGTAAAETRAKAILVLDASGSMWGQIDGKAKWDIAKVAVDRLVTGWDPTIDLGLTVYSHRSKGSCDDIEDIIPVGPVDPARFKAVVGAISPKGKTPMTAAVKRAAEQLKYTEDAATVILVSDGEETCNLDPCSIAQELEQKGVAFTAHVVGFDIRDQATRDQLKCIADNTGGTFVTADDAASLQAALTTVAAATAAPAPTPPPPPAPPAQTTGKGKVTFTAVLNDGVPVTDNGMRWQLFRDIPTQEELRDPVDYTYAAVWSPDKVEPGDYIIEAKLGTATVQQPVKITGEKQAVTVNLGAARLTLTAVEAEGGPAIAKELGWKLRDPASGKDVDYSYDAQPTFSAKAGSYLIVVDYGAAKAEAPITVKPGDIAQVTVTIGAGTVEVEAKPSESEPVATSGVSWKVFPEGSDTTTTYSYDATEVFRLNAGRYRIVAEIGEAVVEQTVEVKAGMAQKLTFTLSVGLMKPTAIFAPGAPKPTRDLTWSVYKAERDMAGSRGDKVTYSYDLEPQFKLPAGKYYVEVESGAAKAGMEVEVKAGAPSAPVINLNAGAILAKAQAGGIKVSSDLNWGVYSLVAAMTGTERARVTYSYDPEPVWIVPAGTYVVTLEAGGKSAEAEITVEAGKPTQVTLMLPQ